MWKHSTQMAGHHLCREQVRMPCHVMGISDQALSCAEPPHLGCAKCSRAAHLLMLTCGTSGCSSEGHDGTAWRLSLSITPQ